MSKACPLDFWSQTYKDLDPRDSALQRVGSLQEQRGDGVVPWQSAGLSSLCFSLLARYLLGLVVSFPPTGHTGAVRARAHQGAPGFHEGCFFTVSSVSSSTYDIYEYADYNNNSSDQYTAVRV